MLTEYFSVPTVSLNSSTFKPPLKLISHLRYHKCLNSDKVAALITLTLLNFTSYNFNMH